MAATDPSATPATSQTESPTPPTSSPMLDSYGSPLTAPPSPAGAPPPRRNVLLVVVAVVVVVLVLVAVLFALGVFSPHTSAGKTNVYGTPSTYGQSNRTAESVASGVTGGPWTLVAALGINTSTSISSPNFGTLSGGSGACTFSAAPSGPSVVTLPATPATAPLGEAAAWMFIAIGSASGEVLMVLVSQNESGAVAVGTSGCATSYQGFGSLAGLAPVNSTVVGAAAFASGGGAFLSSHPGATQLYTLLGPYASLSHGAWAVEYDTCPLSGSGGGSSASWIATFDGASGAPIGSPSTTPVGC